MSVTLVTDPTEQGFNSFVSLEDADEYFAGVYFGTTMPWLDLEEEDRRRLLVTASRALSALSWTGTAVGLMAFPRTYGYSDEAVVPEFIKTVVCEWAKWLYQEGSTANEAPIVKAKIGDLEVQFGTSVSSGSLPSSIVALLTPLAPTYLTVGTQRARSLTMRY